MPNKTNHLFRAINLNIWENMKREPKHAKYGDMEQDYNQNYVQVDKEHWDICWRNVCEMVSKLHTVKSMRICSSGEYFTNRNYGTHTVEQMQVHVSNY